MKSNDSIVWVYRRNKKKPDALRWSVQTVLKNLTNGSHENLFVVGDDPGGWFKGTHIPCRPVTKRGVKKTYGVKMSVRWRKWVDSIHKLNRIIETPEITERFLWLYDDSYIVRPTTIDELAVPRHGRRAKPSTKPIRKKWLECKRRTFLALHEAGFPTLSYSTHFPMVYEKGKMRKTIERFEPTRYPSVIESLYGNQWCHDRAVPVGRALRYTSSVPGSVPTFHPDTLIWNVKNVQYRKCRDVIIQWIETLEAPAPRPVPMRLETFYPTRKQACDKCEENIEGVCAAQKRVDPDRAGLISIGIKIPLAQCPLPDPKWMSVKTTPG